MRVKPGGTDDFMSYPSDFIVGPRLATDLVDLGPYRHVAAVTFKPGGLHRLLGVPVTQFGRETDLRMVLKGVDLLSERLQAARNNDEIRRLIESFFIERLQYATAETPYDKAVAALAQSNGNLPINKVAGWANLSVRQFERRSIAALGLSPKLYSRVLRFSNACLYKEAHPKMSWYKISHELGYADQMHLVNDFKSFTGSTPTEMDTAVSMRILTGIEGRVNRIR